MTNLNDACLLCGGSPEEGMHLVGTKFLKNKPYKYQLCRTCCSKDDDSSAYGGSPSRNKVWDRVEKKLLESV